MWPVSRSLPENIRLSPFSTPGFKEEYAVAVRAFKKAHARSGFRLFKKASASHTLSTTALSAATYDEEYKNGEYAYLSPLLTRTGFENVVGIDTEEVRNLRIIDIGAGSGEFLRFCKDALHVPAANLYAVDVSKESIALAKRDGIAGGVGRIENLQIPPSSFDIAYLSYFIDYDSNQQATFDATLNLLKDGGLMVIEGWFPVRPFALSPHDKNSLSFITKGRTTEEDITLIYNYLQTKGSISLVRALQGKRYVQSKRYGFQKLSSTCIVFKVEKARA